MSVWAQVPAAGTTPRPGPPRPLVITTTLIAATITTLTITPYIGIAILLGATLTELAARRGHHHLHRITTTIARWTARTLFTLLGIPLLLLPWLTGRIYRIDPLTTPGTNGWITRSRRDPRPHDQWRPDTTLTTPPLHHRLRTTLATLTTIALVVAGALGTRSAGETVAGWFRTRADAPPAFADAPWYPDYLRDITWIGRNSVAFEPLSPVRLRDVRTEYVNIADGRRVSWVPPSCDCRRLVVWMYGGSAVFGMGQRDEHTIPSELARIASERGYTLDVVNRGVLGDTQWEEGQRLGWDVANEDPPDLVVFYDGSNDIAAANLVTDAARRPISKVTEEFWRAYTEETGTDPGTPPAGATLVTAPPLPTMDAAETGVFVVERYEVGRRFGSDIARANDLETAYFWQPRIEDREPVDGEVGDSGRAWALLRSDAISASLPDDVVDLTDVFEGINRPIFYDDVHTNEEGAHIVAEAMFEHLRPTLDRLADEPRR